MRKKERMNNFYRGHLDDRHKLTARITFDLWRICRKNADGIKISEVIFNNAIINVITYIQAVDTN